MDPVLGGIGLGLVWGWWIAAAVWAARPDLGRALAGSFLLTGLLVGGCLVLVGPATTAAVGVAAAVSALVGYGVRIQLGRPLEPGG
jgi:hypothetical protein